MTRRVKAAILAIFLGGFGMHKFYIKRIFAGICYLLFCWTGIPQVIGIIEGLSYLLKTDEQFEEYEHNHNHFLL
ncbi:TM2 domain-containing protein [Metabacillus iocasae]|uniref:TM2 domain-containing membrane protein YozV n=1 Tax=Priestia iocasae TaxID=2291674 RepID=A0ABS2QZ28_9BACI|nr:TM2 domain-containing membrane protein YozV [Metabacillus iocasae]